MFDMKINYPTCEIKISYKENRVKRCKITGCLKWLSGWPFSLCFTIVIQAHGNVLSDERRTLLWHF